MPNTSSIPTVKDTLKTLLTARAGLSGVTFTWAYPGPDKMAREHIFYDDPELSEESAQLGNGTRRERYTLPLWVCVRKETNDAKSVEDRAWNLVGQIEQELKPPANSDLGLGPANGLKSLSVQFAGAAPNVFNHDQGYSVEIKVSLSVDARI